MRFNPWLLVNAVGALLAAFLFLYSNPAEFPFGLVMKVCFAALFFGMSYGLFDECKWW